MDLASELLYPVPKEAACVSVGMNVPDYLQGECPKATVVNPWKLHFFQPNNMVKMFMEKPLNRVIFDLGARLGSLEGYLYGEERVEKKYLAGWLENIDQEFWGLPVGTRREIAGDYEEVIKKVVALLQKNYGDGDSDTIRGKELAARLKGGNE